MLGISEEPHFCPGNTSVLLKRTNMNCPGMCHSYLCHSKLNLVISHLRHPSFTTGNCVKFLLYPSKPIGSIETLNLKLRGLGCQLRRRPLARTNLTQKPYLRTCLNLFSFEGPTYCQFPRWVCNSYHHVA